MKSLTEERPSPVVMAVWPYLLPAAEEVFSQVRTRPGIFSASESGFATNGYGDLSPAGYDWWAVILAEVLLTDLQARDLVANERIAREKAQKKALKQTRKARRKARRQGDVKGSSLGGGEVESEVRPVGSVPASSRRRSDVDRNSSVSRSSRSNSQKWCGSAS